MVFTTFGYICALNPAMATGHIQLSGRTNVTIGWRFPATHTADRSRLFLAIPVAISAEGWDVEGNLPYGVRGSAFVPQAQPPPQNHFPKGNLTAKQHHSRRHITAKQHHCHSQHPRRHQKERMSPMLYLLYTLLSKGMHYSPPVPASKAA